MRIEAEQDDSRDFINLIDCVLLGMLERNSPPNIVVIKVDNWFGPKWLGFSGKALGAFGVWNRGENEQLRVPPFVPSRIISQRRFAAPAYEEIHSGDPIHRLVDSTVALLRKASLAAPNTALVWYSGKSRHSGRGAMMVYAPVGESYWAWYAAWQAKPEWQIVECREIKHQDLAMLIDRGSNIRGDNSQYD